ncbi:MAG TPA: RNA 2',3'-cyclic phosphodiesterase [Pyrinomonadaceae bacterium]|nr:RNA 2',3'-cyclic phosphodiesterase [Pyrinomonadaceae bacterium]
MSRTGEQENLWRVFCAVELPEGVRERAAAYAARLRESATQVRATWDKPEKMHVTLKFLGEITPERVAHLQAAATRAASGMSPFALAIEGTGAFHTRGRPHVLWLGVRDDAGQLAGLHHRLEEEAAREKFPRESKKFHPHLTLARLRAPEGARALAEEHRASEFSSESFRIAELLVIRSELGTGGARHSTLSRHPLRGVGTSAAQSSEI